MLERLFQEINEVHFDGFLDSPTLRWNSRLRTSAGRFLPGRRKFIGQNPPVIEVASYLRSEKEAEKHIRDTLAHEMIHYWLWVRKQPYGHTEQFWIKMRQMGVSRYNPVPRNRPHKYLYQCPNCSREFPARRKLGVLACAKCCKEFSSGRYDSRFKLFLNLCLPKITQTSSK